MHLLLTQATNTLVQASFDLTTLFTGLSAAGILFIVFKIGRWMQRIESTTNRAMTLGQQTRAGVRRHVEWHHEQGDAAPDPLLYTHTPPDPRD